MRAPWFRRVTVRSLFVVLLPFVVLASPSAATPRTSFKIHGTLVDVIALSARNAWAVGAAANGRTLIVHWDGKSWHRVTSPRGSLSGIAAVSARNAWAVGQTAGARTLVLHWNGTAWRRVPSPGPAFSKLTAVTALNAHNAWAVGSANKSLILRWNGHTWKRQHSPGGILNDVVALSSRNAWAVGSVFDTHINASKTLIVHWTGHTWTRVASPNPRSNGSGLQGVAASSARSMWSVGCSECAIGGFAQSLLVRSNGHTWRRVHRPRPSGGDLFAVSNFSGQRGWAVGGRYARLGDSQSVKTLIERRSGGRWGPVHSPSPGAEANLAGVASRSARDAWAVGSYQTDAGNAASTVTLILHWNGTRWERSG